MAPTFWGITRKEKRFVVTVKPGSHKKDYAIPTAVFLRDMLKIVSDLREAKFAIYGGKVSIDGVKIKSLHHGIGLMDVIELDGVKEIYRLEEMQILEEMQRLEEMERLEEMQRIEEMERREENTRL